MNEYPWFNADDDEFEDAPPQPDFGNLPKELRKVIRDAKKEAKEAKDEAARLAAELRKKDVESALSKMGAPEKVAKFIPADVENVSAWLEENGDVFGWKPNATPEDKPSADSPSGAPIANAVDETAEAMQRIAATASGAMPDTGAIQRQMAALSDPNLTEEKLLAMINGEQL